MSHSQEVTHKNKVFAPSMNIHAFDEEFAILSTFCYFFVIDGNHKWFVCVICLFKFFELLVKQRL